jgi:D-aminopeptidase
MKAPDHDIIIGELPSGTRNAITDIRGIQVGHVTLKRGKGKLIPGEGPVRTGVTAILPHEGNVYREKVMASASIINGFAKPCGLIQVQELGAIETPIILTNTLAVGVAFEGVIRSLLEQNPDIGITTGSVNPVILECNDSYLNDIQGRHITPAHITEAIQKAGKDIQEGAVGAGTGMSAFEFKGGIGSSSRLFQSGELDLAVGTLVLTNFGKREDLLCRGIPVGQALKDFPGRHVHPVGEGSIIMIVGTDAPLTARQLGRVARRAVMGLARTGGYAAHGSGDVVLAFSTAQRIPHDAQEVTDLKTLPESMLTPLFKATVESVEEAILNSLLQAETTEGRDNRIRYSLPVDEVKSILNQR